VTDLYIDPQREDDARRALLFNGALIVNSATDGCRALREFAEIMISDFFGDDPESAQFTMPVESFIKIASPLKSSFTNSLFRMSIK